MYGKDWVKIAKAMRKADPDIFVGAVAVDQDNGEEWTGYKWWMKGLLPQVREKADFLILHQYFLWPFDSSNKYTNPSHEVFLGNLYKLNDAFKNAQSMQAKYMGDAPALPVALTEFNMVNAAPKETIQLINGLFTAEVLGENIRAGYACSNHWDWRNGLDVKLGGDHALLAVDDPSVPDGTPRPAYYTYVLYSRAFGDKMVETSSSDTKVKAYASRFSGGELGLILVNETKDARIVKLAISGMKPMGRFMGWVLTGKDPGAKQVTFNGAAGPDNGGGPFPVDDIAPYRGIFDSKKAPAISIPPNSVCGLVLY
jgi:hypothetical protein